MTKTEVCVATARPANRSGTFSIEVNGQPLEVHAGETILTALRAHGLTVPTLCHLEGLLPSGACRLCVVEVDGLPGLVPSCSYPVAPGMKIRTQSPVVVDARRTIVELLLASHPDDCLYCTRNGSCSLQDLSRDLGIRERHFRRRAPAPQLDLSSPAIVRDPEKCVLCGKCVRVCEEVQGVGAIDFVGRGAKAHVGSACNVGLGLSSCVACGQCVVVCPTGALTERSAIPEVVAALADPTKTVVVQHAPAVSVSLAEEFGLPEGTDVDGQMVAALRRLGFDRVFDTSFTADLTIMEEASELVARVRSGGVLPMLTSCSPGWVRYVETFHPELIPNLSTCKSPQQMMGALVKRVFAERQGLSPRQIVSVAVMPCTAKKLECTREEMADDSIPDVDHVLTTRELARLLRQQGIDLAALPPEAPDDPFGERTGAGKIFGATGGVMEAAVRTAHFLLTGRELESPDVTALRPVNGNGCGDGSACNDGLRTLRVDIGGLQVGAAVVSGLGAAARLLDEVRAGRKDLHFIEVMTCPGGCVAGGGQPLGAPPEAVRARMRALQRVDATASRRVSHANPFVARLYAEVLGEPLGEMSHRLLHTHYRRREAL